MWIAIGAAILLICVLIYADNRRVTCSRHKIKTDAAQKRIVQLSDIHSFRYTDSLMKRVRMENPELIIVTGDLWDRSKLRVSEMLELMRRLTDICDTVYVPGNHEFHEPDHEQLFLQIEKSGVYVLRHRIAEFDGVQLLGMDLMRYQSFNENELRRLEQRDGFRMAAVHFPQFFEEEYAEYDIDLVISGHAHGGQFRIPFIKKGLYSPGQGVFPKYSEGMHEKNGVKMIVSRGIGNSRFPFRLFNPPEVIVIELGR